MQKEISIKKIRADAREAFLAGENLCAESVAWAIKKNIAPDMDERLIAATSGFSVGVGGSSCLCGSISAAVVCLGYFFGRDFPSTMTDPKSLKSIALAYELQEKFKVKNQSLCCHFHKKENCAELAGDAAELSAEIIAREFGIKLTDGGAK